MLLYKVLFQFVDKESRLETFMGKWSVCGVLWPLGKVKTP